MGNIFGRRPGRNNALAPVTMVLAKSTGL